MNVVDIGILVLLVASSVLGFRSGVIQSLFSLIGLIAGIAVAGRYYREVPAYLGQARRDWPVMQLLNFCLIALLVMVVAGLIGMLLKKMVHGVGLGWLDRLAGLFFGLLRGVMLVTLTIVLLAAFYPETLWLGQSQLAGYFLGSVDVTIQMAPGELKEKVLNGIHTLEKDAPDWMPGK